MPDLVWLLCGGIWPACRNSHFRLCVNSPAVQETPGAVSGCGSAAADPPCAFRASQVRPTMHVPLHPTPQSLPSFSPPPKRKKVLTRYNGSSLRLAAQTLRCCLNPLHAVCVVLSCCTLCNSPCYSIWLGLLLQLAAINSRVNHAHHHHTCTHFYYGVALLVALQAGRGLHNWPHWV